MTKVTTLKRGDELISAPPWEYIKDRIVRLDDEQSATVEINDDAWLIVLRSFAFGYLVTGCTEGEKDYHTLIERQLGDDPIAVFDGGNLSDFPRYAFVSESLMLKAVQSFSLTGKRDPECEWVLEDDAMY